MYGAELWRASARELLPMKRFYNRCVRALAGYNLFSMRAKHVHDADIRGRLDAPHFQHLLDRAVLRWAGHCSRMGSQPLPLQLLMGDGSTALAGMAACGGPMSTPSRHPRGAATVRRRCQYLSRLDALARAPGPGLGSATRGRQRREQ